MRARLARITEPEILDRLAGVELITSLEGENPGGSVKDHLVHGELTSRLESGQLKRGDTVIEATAGSTGLSLAFYARSFGLHCTLLIPQDLASYLRERLAALGATLIPIDPATAPEALEDLVLRTGASPLNQFKDANLQRHYFSFARKILDEVKAHAVIGAIGTGHSLAGFRPTCLERGLHLYSAEPLPPTTVPGVRNLDTTSLGPTDPIDRTWFRRVLLAEDAFFAHPTVSTDQGLVEVTPSFRLVLGAATRLAATGAATRLFALGAANRLAR